MPRLPDFDNPPVIETVLSIQFEPLRNFSVPHFGIYWEQIRKKYDRFQVVPPLAAEIEDFGSERQIRPFPTTNITLQVQPSDTRCWFLDEPGNHLVQLQRDRFIHNWRKVTGDEDYPHYESIRPAFENEWVQFCDFLGKEKLGEPNVMQCEVTYVNHIELDGPIKSFSDMHKVANDLSAIAPRKFLPKAEQIRFTSSYEMTDKRGRLYISMQPIIRSRDAKEVIQLNLTTRGKPISSDVRHIMEWLDLGREWIVQGFTDFTSEEMHAYWRRKNDR